MTEHLRVHIIPVGYDSTRITEPLIERKADKVYFIRHKSDKGYSKYFDFVKKELKDKKELETSEEFIDMWDLFQCIKKFKEIAKKEKNNHIYINVSTGSKITSIAGMFTSMLIENVEPYYVHIEYPSQTKKEKIIKDKVGKTDDLPVFEINKPPIEHLVVLQMLSNGDKMKKKELIDELISKKIIQQKDQHTQFFTDYAKHSQLRTILEPMENIWEFIKIEGKGKKSRVQITSQGSFALKIFGNDVD